VLDPTCVNLYLVSALAAAYQLYRGIYTYRNPRPRMYYEDKDSRWFWHFYKATSLSTFALGHFMNEQSLSSVASLAFLAIFAPVCVAIIGFGPYLAVSIAIKATTQRLRNLHLFAI
jgi:hypothetical protein